jgi:hypothetical protein
VSERIWNVIKSIHIDREENVIYWFKWFTHGIGVKKDEKLKISHSTFDRKLNMIYFAPFAKWESESDSTWSNLEDLKNYGRIKKGGENNK